MIFIVIHVFYHKFSLVMSNISCRITERSIQLQNKVCCIVICYCELKQKKYKNPSKQLRTDVQLNDASSWYKL